MKKHKGNKRIIQPHRLLFVMIVIGLFLLSGPNGLSQSSLSSGESIYTENCASCHEGGFKGWITGAPKTGDQEEWARFFKNGADKMTENTFQGTKGMKPKGGCQTCTKEEIKAAVDHILSRTR